MKKHGILNSDISRVLSYLRHTDTVCICDSGLPCPDGVELIDVSLSKGMPDFLAVLKAVSDDMHIEKILLAEEIREQNNAVLHDINYLLPDLPAEFIPHTELKKKLTGCKAIIRTGEMTPFANIILQAACLF